MYVYNAKEDADIFVENLEETQTLALEPSARMEDMARKTMIPLSLYKRNDIWHMLLVPVRAVSTST